ncbi:PREDICTED: TAF6-like RNA polymerase II p300/CBP-associated factor-associated factor 65 kDa subunit 6L, partial [Calidris pugnax]|uniref:TAF6-like RNA polymerase II p300/CBP-associated factor-associated factor 65 kDa subunit 6L n=1 Tax=Calidris pugnax TaxID=198806 RepID=UPI00071E15D0
MAEREERRFVELPRESVRLMAESTGLELSDEVAALLAEDVCYRLREATQNSSQFMKHTRRRKLTVEDFNRALRWSNVEVPGMGGLRAKRVKSVSHDLEQLNRLLHVARSLVGNPFLCLGSYLRSLVASVTYCALEPLAASINPLNDHWTLRDYAAMLLSRIFG